ncbi:MAG: nickel-dependent lactate racemase [Deltaproteobacteria bacterium]|nr:nickel-dependent lactate racemase [Deltaproteobacteria bacterium]
MAKKTLEIGYSEDHFPVTIEEDRIAGVYYPNLVEIGDEAETIRNALAKPVNSPDFKEFLSGGGKVLVIVNDGTRPTPTSKVLDEIGEELEAVNPEYIVATGVHRAPSEKELDFIFGKWKERVRDRLIIHDSRDDSVMVKLGTSRAGTEMWVNRKGVEADKIVIIGSVEPHYFAGFTGGRKAFLPGIAAFKTIEQNHQYALRPQSHSLALDGNPVHDDMVDALKEVVEKPIFSIQTVLDRDRKLYAVTAGHIHGSFDAAIDAANEVFCVKIPEKSDIVLSVAPYPMEVDLYQSQKCLDNGKLALNDDGILIAIMPCRTGIGEESFYDLLSGQPTPQLVLEEIDKGFKLGYHKAAKMAEIMCRAEIWAVSNLPDETLSKIFIRPMPSIQEALDEALEKKPDAKVVFLMEGSITVPNITG